jgi:hypothetical protein
MRTLPLWALCACSSLDPAQAPGDTSRAWRPEVSLSTNPRLITTLPYAVEVDVQNNGRLVTVVVLASQSTGAGPCDRRTGVCLDLAPPLVEIGRAQTRNGAVELSWLPTAPVGSTVHLQAALVYEGRLVETSALRSATVEPYLPGCTWSGSPDFDPAANVDDGSCDCPRQLIVDTPGALAPYAACTTLYELRILGRSDTTISLPALQDLQVLEIASDVEEVELPALASFYDLQVHDTSRLRRLSLPAVQSATNLDIYRNAALETVELAVSEQLVSAEIWENPALGDLRWPQVSGLLDLNVSDNGQIGQIEIGGLAEWGYVAVVGEARLQTLDLGAPTLLYNLLLLDDPLLRELPTAALQEVADTVGLAGLPAVTTITWPALTTVGELSVEGLDGLTSLTLPPAAQIPSIDLTANAALQTLRAPALTTLGRLSIQRHPALTQVELPAVANTGWEAALSDNAAWCVTDVPLFASPPPGASVSGQGNACDP